MLDLTHNDQKRREQNPNAKKGKYNKDKFMDLLNALRIGLSTEILSSLRLRSTSKSLSRRWRRWMILGDGWETEPRRDGAMSKP